MRRYTMIVKVKKEFADAVTLLLEHLARLGCNPFTTYELEENKRLVHRRASRVRGMR